MYYLSIDAEQSGPFALDYLRTGWKDGTLSPETLFWQEGMAEWQPLESIRTLLEETSPVVSNAEPMIIAGFWRRVAAFLIDVLIIGIVGFGSGYFLFDFYMMLGLAGLLVGLVIATAYFGLLNSSLGSGQTLGKRLLGIRVEDAAGNFIPPARSILRYLILAFPFFLNKALFAGLITNIWLGGLATIPVFAGFVAFTYLLIFNRRTRQLVHDLAIRTYVVRVSSPRPALAPRMWRGHAIVVAILCLVIVVIGGLSSLLIRLPFFQHMLVVRQAVLDTGEVQATTVTGGTTYVATVGHVGSTRVLSIMAHVKGHPRSSEAMASKFASVALKADTTIPASYDTLNVSISYGYDIGIASSTVTDTYIHTPDEWKQVASRLGTSP